MKNRDDFGGYCRRHSMRGIATLRLLSPLVMTVPVFFQHLEKRNVIIGRCSEPIILGRSKKEVAEILGSKLSFCPRMTIRDYILPEDDGKKEVASPRIITP